MGRITRCSQLEQWRVIPLALVFVGFMGWMTLSASGQAAPFAFTQAEGPVTTTNATLNGMLLANGSPTTAWFEWGTNDFSQKSTPVSVGSGTKVVRVSAAINGLTRSAVYHCRLVASNAFGTVSGVDTPLTPGGKVVGWGQNGWGQAQAPPGLTNAVGVGCGWYHSLAVKTDGTVVGWGDNDAGQATVPDGLGNVVAVAAGSDYSLALRADGTVVGWGNTTIPVGLSNVVAIAGGGYHSVALTADGTVVAWGVNDHGEATLPPGLSNAVAVACGGHFSMALQADGTVQAWGYDGDGERDVPAGLTNVEVIACGYQHGLVLLQDGSLTAWGDYLHAYVPGGVTNVIGLAAGQAHCIVLKSDNTVMQWGWDTYGGVSSPAWLENVCVVADGGFHTLTVAPETAPHAAAVQAIGVANEDLVVQLGGTDPNGDQLRYRITSLPVVGRLCQYSNGTRGPDITSSNVAVADASSRVIYIPDTNGFGNPYTSFSYVATDGELDSSPATATIIITARAPGAETGWGAPNGAGRGLLGGMAAPNGPPSVAWFEWGTDVSYGSVTPATNCGKGLEIKWVVAPISGLVPGVAYHCRLVASNLLGVTFGQDRMFSWNQRLSSWGNKAAVGIPSGSAMSNVVAVAAGDHHSVALKADGTVLAWGANASFQTNVPQQLTNVVAISAGYTLSLALRTDGTVSAWDANGGGQVPVPVGLSNVIAIAAGGYHSLALRGDGTVVGWGYDANGQASPPDTATNVVAITAGGYSSLGLTREGNVVGWGNNSSGQAVAPSGLSNVVALAAGVGHVVALMPDASIVAWGTSYFGESVVPTAATNVLAIAAGGYHSLCVRGDGTVAAWGNDEYGQIDIPGGLSNVVAVAGGVYHSLALGGNAAPGATPINVAGPANVDLVIALSGDDPNGDNLSFRVVSLPTTGTLYQCVSGVRGGQITTTNTPVADIAGRVIYAPGLDSIGASSGSFQFVANDGALDSAPAPVSVTMNARAPGAATQWAGPASGDSALIGGLVAPNSLTTAAWFEWGINSSYGQVVGRTNASNLQGVNWIAAPVSGLQTGVVYHCRIVASNALGVGFGNDRAFGLIQRVTAWGANSANQINVSQALGNVAQVAAGAYHSLALKADGKVAAWGANTNGQTTLPPTVSNIVAVAAGGQHNLALNQLGMVVAWGLNDRGQAVVPPSLSNVLAIAAGTNHSLALRGDGTVVAWGDNASGKATVPGNAANTVAMAAGGQHNLVVRSNSTVFTWGANTAGLQTVPAGLSNVVAVAAGSEHSLALRINGTMAGWGRNNFGQATVPSGLSNVVAIASSCAGQHNLTLRTDGTVVAWGNNNNGQTNVPPALSNMVAVACGGNHSLGLGAGNARPSAIASSVVGMANQDLVIAMLGSDPNGDILRFKIVTQPAPGRLFQYANGGRGVEITAPNTNVSDAQGRVIYVPDPDGYGNLYSSFTFQATDGDLDSTSATVTIGLLAMKPAVATGWGSPDGTNSAVLCGMVYANGLPALSWVEWGTNSAYGQITSVTNAGTGSSGTWIALPVTTPIPGAVYQFRLVASNSLGVAYGAAHLFTTRQAVTGWGFNSAGQVSGGTATSNLVMVAAGGYHSLGLRKDGIVAGWGSNTNGQTSIPVSLSNAIAIAGGGYHSLALKADGTVAAWGANTNGQATPPAGLDRLIGMAAGSNHSVALLADGTVRTWGSNVSGQTNVPSGLSNVVAVASGADHILALQANGNIVAWGRNNFGQTNIPPGLSNVVAVAGGVDHSMALNASGAVIVWGRNNFGQTNLPAGLSNVVAISAGWDHCLAWRADGSLVSWGRSTFGQTAAPSGLGKVVAVCGGAGHTLALAATQRGPFVFTAAATRVVNGTAQLNGVVSPNGLPTSFWFEWGASTNYAEGTAIGSISAASNLVWASAPVVGLLGDVGYRFRIVGSNVLGVAYGADRILTPGQRVAAWGENIYGQATIPAGLASALAVAGGYNHSAALKADGTVAAWGWNVYGQANVPPNLSNAVAIAAGGHHCLAMKADGTMVAWGLNISGQTNTPAGLSNLVAVAAGDQHSLALRADGTLTAWGLNTSGQTAVPTGLNNVVAIAGGANHSLALRADGTVVAWGQSIYGQTSVPAGLSNVVSVAGGWEHSSALKADGTVVVWGRNAYGETNVPTGLSNVTAIASGGYHCLALKADGNLVIWGRNNFSQTIVPVGLNNAVALAGGAYHSLALAPNVPPQASSLSVTGAVNCDCVITLSAWDPNGDAVFDKVATLPVAGELFQYSGNGRGAAILDPGTQLTDPLSRLVFAPTPNSTGWPYAAFSFVASDGGANSAPAAVTVNLISAPVIGASRPSLGTNGTFSLSFIGDTNASYTVWASTNLTTWGVLGTATQLQPGVFQFSDNFATNLPQRFYRVTCP